MAKKKKKKAPQLPAISPVRFIREKARKLPIGKCYINKDWQEKGMATVFVTRLRPNGNLVVGSYLVDTYCLGVKDLWFETNLSEYELSKYLDSEVYHLNMEEISYNEAHNIIFGAIEFAEEGGIEPVETFKNAKYILEEDNDDIPIIDYEFGLKGKHYLVVGPSRKEKKFFGTLKKNLGDDFEYTMPLDDWDEADDEIPYEDDEDWDDDDDDNGFAGSLSSEEKEELLARFEAMKEQMGKVALEKYSYTPPEYPESLTVKNQFIADEFLSEKNVRGMPKEVIDRILALPPDEAAEDIGNIILYVIGQTYKGIADGSIEKIHHSAIIHSLLFLAQLKSEKGLEPILELMRQSMEFVEMHMGDFAYNWIVPALYSSGLNNVPAIENFMRVPGYSTYLRAYAADALGMIYAYYPERRAQLIETFRKLLVFIKTNLPECKACDGTYAAFFVSTLVDINAKELMPEIKELFDTGMVNTLVVGNYDRVKERMNSKGMDMDKFLFPDIYDEYASISKHM